jgi:hypothetical protein
MPCGEGPDYLIEESRRQETIVIAITASDFPKIIARPIEFVALCNNAFFPSGFVFVVPQIGIGNDKARFGRRLSAHAPALFRFKHSIEMRMPLVHA